MSYYAHYLTDKGLEAFKETLKPRYEAEKAIRDSRFTPQHIINICYSYFDVPKEEVKTKNRLEKYVRAKQFSQYFIKKEFRKLTLNQIARYFDMHHATVIHSFNKINDLIEFDSEYAFYANDIKKKIVELYK